MIAKILVGVLAIALASANSDSGLEYTAALDVNSNYEFGSTKKEFRVHYPGLDDATGDVKIKILKEDGTDLHEYTVTDKENPKAYYFGLNDAEEDKTYKVKICDGTKCSKETKALGQIKKDSENPKAKCHNVKVNPVNMTVTDWKSQGEITLTLERVEEFAQASDLTHAPKYQGVKDTCQNGGDPCWLKDSKEFYVAMMYDMTKWKKFLEFSQYKWLRDTVNYNAAPEEDKTAYIAALDAGTADIASPYCERKYLLTNNVHIMKKDTKEILHRYKDTLSKNAAPGLLSKYVFKNNAAKIPVEMKKEVAGGLTAGDYVMWTAFCLTDKDANDSTFCMDPLFKDFTVAA